MLVAGLIKCGEFCKMPRPYSDDLRWRMVYQRLFFEKSHEEIALQLFVSPKALYRTISTFLTHGYSVGVFVSHRYHSISISAFFCVLIASSLLCAPGRNRLDQSRTSLEDFPREPV